MDVELLLESHESNIDSKVNFGELRLKICQCFHHQCYTLYGTLCMLLMKTHIARIISLF